MLIGLIKAGGPVCIALAVLTLCVCVLWHFVGRDLAVFALDGLKITRDIAVAQQQSADSALKTVELAGRVGDRLQQAIDKVTYRAASN